MKKVNRLEVIDHTNNGEGRELVKYLRDSESLELSFQDDNRTLKIFILDNKI